MQPEDETPAPSEIGEEIEPQEDRGQVFSLNEAMAPRLRLKLAEYKQRVANIRSSTHEQILETLLIEGDVSSREMAALLQLSEQQIMPAYRRIMGYNDGSIPMVLPKELEQAPQEADIVPKIETKPNTTENHAPDQSSDQLAMSSRDATQKSFDASSNGKTAGNVFNKAMGWLRAKLGGGSNGKATSSSSSDKQASDAYVAKLKARATALEAQKKKAPKQIDIQKVKPLGTKTKSKVTVISAQEAMENPDAVKQILEAATSDSAASEMGGWKPGIRKR